MFNIVLEVITEVNSLKRLGSIDLQTYAFDQNFWPDCQYVISIERYNGFTVCRLVNFEQSFEDIFYAYVTV